MTSVSSSDSMSFAGSANTSANTVYTKTTLSRSSLVHAIECVQGGLTFAGAVGNLLVIITLIRRRYQSQFACAMFIHQTVMDFFVCVISLIIILTRNRTLVFGLPVLDAAICHIWESQLIYWYFVFLSVQNLIMIGLDRYLAVFRPLSYKGLRYKDAAIFLFVLHLYSLMVNVADVFMMRFDATNQTCLSEHLFPTAASAYFFNAYGIIWFFLVYLIPVVGLLLIYGIIVVRLTAHKDSKASRHRQRAASELTKTAVVITVIFIVCFSYDSIYYLLGNIQVVKYEFNTPIQTLGVVLVALNSCVNPLVYCLMMKTFRSRLYSAVCCCFWQFFAPSDPIGCATIGECKSGCRTRHAPLVTMARINSEASPSMQRMSDFGGVRQPLTSSHESSRNLVHATSGDLHPDNRSTVQVIDNSRRSSNCSSTSPSTSV